ncbi:MAG: phospholipase D family protein [Acidimicrobiia bacterium]
MLRTDERALLVDLLTPPEPGYRLERAVGTTFTMQLESLLRVPLAVVGAEWRDGADPLGIMEAVRSSADRIDVFCQAGMVTIPSSSNALLAFLEPLVHQVRRPQPGHLFHPKVWLASFVHPEHERRFRFLCGSRNLTGDRAWDTVLALSGVQTGARRAVNRPLGEFVASLPERVPEGVPADRSAGVIQLAEWVRYADWEPPAGITDHDWLAFHWMDRGRRFTGDFNGTRDRLVISPFLNEQGLATVWPTGACTVVSRPESFAALGPEYLEQLRDEWEAPLFELDDNAALPDEDDEDIETRWSLSGLHAKVIVLERGFKSHVFIGSANATDAAWSGNTEFVVEVVGPRKSFGVKAVLADTDGGLLHVLRPYTGSAVEAPDEPTLQEQLEWALVDVAALTFLANARKLDDDTWVEEVKSRSNVPGAFPGNANLTARLLTYGDGVSVAANSKLDASWSGLSPDEITPFIALELTAGPTSKRVRAGCVVLATLTGDPPDRLDRLIARQVGSPEAFLRFLLLLLQIGRGESSDIAALLGDGGGADRGAFGLGSGGVLESLVLALAEHPQSIDEVDALATRLSATEEGRAVLPPEWNEFWPQILEARDRVRGGSA